MEHLYEFRLPEGFIPVGNDGGGEPLCPAFDEGLEFIDNEKVYVIDEEKEFVYQLDEYDDGMEIIFFNPSGQVNFFEITMESEDAFGLNGSGIIKKS